MNSLAGGWIGILPWNLLRIVQRLSWKNKQPNIWRLKNTREIGNESSPSLKVDLDEIEAIILGDGLKRDIVEGDSANEAKVRVK